MTDFASVYAGALYSLAVDEHKEAEYYDELRQIGDVLQGNPELVKLLDSAAVAPDERLQTVDDVFAGCAPYIVNTIKLITEKRRMFCFAKCIGIFSDKYEEAHNIERVTAVTAVALEEDLMDKLKGKLAAMTGKDIILNNEVDPGLIGGVLLRFKNREMDGSLKTRLAELEKAIRL